MSGGRKRNPEGEPGARRVSERRIGIRKESRSGAGTKKIRHGEGREEPLEKCRKFVRRNRDCLAVLVCVLAVLLCFAGQKEGFHLDEVLSYDLANAEYNPFILPNQPVGRLAKYVEEEIRGGSFWETCANLGDTLRDLVVNRGESKILNYEADVYPDAVWIGRDRFRDYLTVTDRDAFQYLSVYFNARTDIHPPLYYMLLHTVCSVFRGSASPFLGCLTNILVVLASCVLLMKLGILLEEKGIAPRGYGRAGGMCAALLYGISRGGIVSMLLSRMYSLLTFFLLLTFYIHVKKWLGEGFAVKKFRLAAVTAAGFLTQYFFVLYCIPLAAVTAGLLLFRKRFRELRIYAVCMFLAGAAALVLFPFALEDVFSSSFGQSVAESMGNALGEYGMRLRIFGQLLTEGYFGSMALGISVIVLIGGGWILLAAGRKKKEYREVVDKANMSDTSAAEGTVDGTGNGETENGTVDGTGDGETVDGIGSREAENRTGSGESKALWLLYLIPALSFFLLSAEAVPFWELRYMMPVFPFIAILLAVGLVKIFHGAERIRKERIGKEGIRKERIKKEEIGKERRGYLILVPAALLVVVSIFTYDNTLLYKGYNNQLEIARQYRNLPCVCVYEWEGYYCNVPEFMEYDRTLITGLWEFRDKHDISGMEEDQIILLRKTVVNEEETLAILEGYGWKVEKILMEEEESVYGDTLYLCVKAEQNQSGGER